MKEPIRGQGEKPLSKKSVEIDFTDRFSFEVNLQKNKNQHVPGLVWFGLDYRLGETPYPPDIVPLALYRMTVN